MFHRTAVQLARSIRQRELSSCDLLGAYLERIARVNPSLNAVVTLDEERARARARQADEASARGEVWGPLHGLPVTIKDSFETKGLRTTSGSPTLSNYIPEEDSAVVAKLKLAGAIVFGKTNVSENLSDWQSSNPLFGRTNNPWDLTRTPGGSSGGAAAAVAAGLTTFDLGSDLGGSIRVPAHYCGICGFKPTEGRVSQAGHRPVSSLLNAVGPLARSVADLALVFGVIAESGASDSRTAPLARRAPPAAFADLKISWTTTYPDLPIADEIAAALEKFTSKLGGMGSQICRNPPNVDIELQSRVRETLRDFMLLEARDPSIRHAHPKPPEFSAALRQRERFMEQWEAFFERWDVFLCPAAMSTAFPHCAPNAPQYVNGRQVEYARMFYFSTLFNCTGHPALVIPLALDSQGLPIGLQVVGPRFGDERLLAVAAMLEEAIEPIGRPALRS